MAADHAVVVGANRVGMTDLSEISGKRNTKRRRLRHHRTSEGELVRDMMEWFAGRENSLAPDERTVRRKVSAIWKELRSA